MKPFHFLVGVCLNSLPALLTQYCLFAQLVNIFGDELGRHRNSSRRIRRCYTI